MSILLRAGIRVEEAFCRAWHGIRGGLAERKVRLLPLLLPTRTVGLRFSRVQGEDAESKPAYCRLREETRAGMEIKGWSETVRECGSRSRLALCRLPSDATHSAHYNKAVVCSAGSVQQGDKVLPLYQKQLQRGKKVLEQEISSFEFSLSLSFPSSSQTETASPSSRTVRAVGGTSRNLSLCLWRLCRVGAWLGFLSQRTWPQVWDHRAGSGVAHRGELLAVKVRR